MNPSIQVPGTALRVRRVPQSGWVRLLSNKVPEVTLLFWVVKALSTTVGQAAADYLARDLALGLSATTAIMSILLATVLITQFSLRRHVPSVYWSSVVMISVVGTLLADDLARGIGLGLWTTSLVFAVGLSATFVVWYRSEHTLSIHTIVTRRREAFYWCAVLFTFALGTSVGDLLVSELALGFLQSLAILGGILVAIAVAYRGGLSAVATFWAAYVVTRPFGAAFGDVLTARPAAGGLGLGTETTTGLFVLVILTAVGWFTLRQRRRRAVFSVASGGRAHAGPTVGF